MSWLGKLRGTGTEERNRGRARNFISRASVQKESGHYAGVAKDLDAAIGILRLLSTAEDRQLRALCCLWRAEITLLAATPPLQKEVVWKCQALCDQADFELAPLLEDSVPFTEWSKWYFQSNPQFPIGLIEMLRGCVLHFSSSLMDKERLQAATHYQNAVRLLDGKSAEGKTVRQLLADLETSIALAEETRALPDVPTEARAFGKFVGAEATRLEYERLKKAKDNN